MEYDSETEIVSVEKVLKFLWKKWKTQPKNNEIIITSTTFITNNQLCTLAVSEFYLEQTGANYYWPLGITVLFLGSHLGNI